MNYYKVLNITNDAELSDIKKAYFKLVREYPPEKFPEKFKKIREAYEFLQVEQNREIYKKVGNLPDNIAYVYSYALRLENEGKRQSAIKVLEEGLKIEPEQKELLVYLGKLYNANNDTGKAVNVYSKLLNLYPDDDSIIASAAISYSKRGYFKKAYSLFVEAFELGNREPDFLMAYSDYCEEYISDESSWEILFLLLDTSTDIKLFKEALKDIFERYDEDKFLSASVNKLSDLVDNRWDILQKCEDTIIDITNEFLFSPDEYLFDVEIDVDLMVKYVQVLKKTKFNSSSFDATLRAIDLYVSIKQLNKDDRLSEYINNLANMVTSIEIDKYLNENDDFITNDIESTVLSQKMDVIYYLNELENEIRIFTNEYPALAELLKEFLYDIETMKGTEELWEKYKRQYCIKMGYPEDSDLVMGTDPFVREEPKVGRNDPCPCGSGKKYKKCCGK